MVPFETLVIVAAVFAFVGIILGALVGSLMGGRGKKEEASKAPSPIPPVIKPQRDEQEVAVLLRDPSSGRLVVELEGVPHDQPQDIDEKKRVELQKTAQEWFVWLGGRIQPVQPRQAAVVPQPKIQTPIEAAATAGMPAEGVEVTPALPAATDQKLPDMDLASGSIVNQINNILQGMIIGTPLAERHIRLSEDPKSGVVVWVGQERFDGIDAVEDPDVNAMLKRAAAEWERRSANQRR